MTREKTPTAKYENGSHLELSALIGVPAEATAEEYLQAAAAAHTAAGLNMVRAGECLLRYREETKHGDWLPRVEKIGIEARHAQQLMQVARYLRSLPAEERSRLVKLPHTKVLAISTADPEVVDELLEEGALDGKQPLSVRDLRERLQKEIIRGRNLESQVATAEHKAEILERQLAHQTAERKLPLWFVVARSETVALAERMSLALGELDAMAAEQIFAAPFKTDHDKAYVRMAAGGLYHNLAGITANAQLLLKRMLKEFGSEISEDKNLLASALDGNELQHLVRNRMQLLRENEAERQVRQAQRGIDMPRGRGRPKGSKNKSKAR